jgi:serine/threonine protein phosphatase PrpC
MHIKPGNAQHIGRRSTQQDAFGFTDIHDYKLAHKIGSLCVLADGMGGHAYGADAAKTAVSIALETFPQVALNSNIGEALDEIIRRADQSVVELSQERGEPGNMGTTLLLVAIHNEWIHWRSVGDSRIYLWRDPYLCQMNREHTYGSHLDREVLRGAVSQSDAEREAQREAITSFVGQGPVSEIDSNLRGLRLRDGDHVILCSDGLFKSLDESTIMRVLKQSSGPQEAAENLLTQTLALENPRQDNVTIMLIECLTDQPTKARSRSLLDRFKSMFKNRSSVRG